jgi:ribosomal protein S18 acetylase RimI-like enzyme
MVERQLSIRPFQTVDEAAIVSLWLLCELTVPWNNPYKDIARKLKVQPDLFLVGMLDSFLTASVRGGYDGHRVWINYLAVHPDFQSHGFRLEMMENVKSELRRQVTPKSICRFSQGKIKKGFFQKLRLTDGRS